ncbi:flagellar filament capping protein FliD [Paenalcaligenes niemegkensis]|uniref:flagellar filament capping protein FliD n=1 Tax=Paenalcaligenes niemegkensis TaxID=2895469 RepID=UPI001EE7AE0A|nr:flagellar filament capping protein FliD [Paenalcaligenes niemegkensis]MCQ9616016.1 flagellar filament capping protein FliD [Paenalcaligenes niemegkensis]
MAISSIGVGSGLPLDDLLADLRKAENSSLVLIQNKQIEAENRLSGYSKLKSAIDALQTAAKTLGNTDTYGALRASSSKDSIRVTADNTAIAGNYSVNVTQLASAHRLTFAPQASRSDANSETEGGTLSVTLGNGDQHEISLEGFSNSLEGMVKAINSDSKLGISATLVNTGDPDAPHRLMITANNTGTDASVSKIEIRDNAELNAFFGFDASSPDDSDFTQTLANNAKLTINDIDITSQSNTVENAIEGVTLRLNELSSDSDVNISIVRDDSVATKAIKGFVDAYNSLHSTLKSLTSYDVEAQQASALTGDSLTRRIQSQVRDSLNVFSEEGNLRNLSQLGITTDPIDGKLLIDDTKLEAALKDDLVDVTKLLTGDNGLSKRVMDVTEPYLDKDGFIDNVNESINENIKQLASQMIRAEERIDIKMENYRRQFSQLDVMVNQMNGISSYLTQQLSMLSNMNNSNS